MGNGVISFILVSNFSCCNVGWPSLSKMAICYAKKKKKKTCFGVGGQLVFPLMIEPDHDWPSMFIYLTAQVARIF